jgi:plasmid stabilization system protein ParE
VTFQLSFSPRAEADLEEIMTGVRAKAPLTADNWLARLMIAVDSLKILPTRFGLAAEAGAVGLELRELLYGKRTGTYRILYTVTGQAVRIHHVRRASRGPLTVDDLF